MYRLSQLVILVLVFAVGLQAQSENPHGEGLKMDCAACHTAQSWDIPSSFWTTEAEEGETPRFDHNETRFALEGQHSFTDCRFCHETLVFSEANSECISCHIDIHEQTVGTDCARCHTEEHWLVDDIADLHVQNGFPLLGSHATASCDECHVSASDLQFTRIGNDCYTCHQADYASTANPNHISAGYSIECLDCHEVNANDWSSSNIIHDFFPLVQGHDISDCNACHTTGDFTVPVPTDCVACHQEDYNMTSQPNHQVLGFSTDCAACHTLAVDWMPAQYLEHDALYFPIHSGAHNGEWTTCADCHTDPTNYAIFTCTTCHTASETNGEHNGVPGYIFESTACLACHPTGSEDGAFNHNDTNFPLTGAHLGVDCIECHANGYEGTPTDCVACHQDDYNATTNPDHQSLGFSNDCAACHITDAWTPAEYLQHDALYFPIYSGNHNNAWQDCAECHTTPNNYSLFSCTDCHEHNDLNQLANDHNDVNNYSPASTACYACHPNGD